MLRLAFAFSWVAFGGYYALQSPFYALLFYLSNAYFRPELWVWDNTTIRALNLSFIVGIYLCLATIFSKERRPIDKSFFFVFLLLLHTLGSALFAEDFAYSWRYWQDFIRVIIIVYIMVLLVDNLAKFRITLMVIIWSLFFEIKQGLVHIVLSPGEKNFNEHPVLGDDNGVAIGMLMLVPLCAVLAQTTAQQWLRWSYRLLLLGALYRALSTYSRGAFLACLAMGVVYWLRTPRKWRMLCGILVLVLLIVPLMPERFWNRMQTIETYEEDQEHSALGRLHFWAVAHAMGAAHPVFGVGFNGYTRLYDTYDFLRGRYGRNRAVHSSWFGVIAELGYVGLMLYGIVVFISMHNCYVVHRLTAQFPTVASLRLYSTALEAGLVVWFVAGAFHIYQYNEFAWHYLAFTFILKRVAVDMCARPPAVPASPRAARALPALS